MERNQDPARREMRRAVETFPRDVWFADALGLLASAVELGVPRNNLLEVLQQERRTVERRAVRAGLPPACLGECYARTELHRDRPQDPRTGIFECDVVEVYLPDFLARANTLEQRRTLPSFALHASRIYRGRLRQIARRERHRGELVVHTECDARAHLECTALTNQGETTIVASPAMTAWIPSPEDRLRERVLRDALRAKLAPLDFQIADLFMQGLIHQGDKGEIAQLLGVVPARITAAIDHIRRVLHSLGFCR